MIKLLKNKKGMTLIELVVGMLIFTIVAVSVTTILASTVRVYVRANDLAEINTLLDNLSNELLSDLWGATDVKVSGSELTITNVSTTVVEVSGTRLAAPNIDTIVYDIETTGSDAGILLKDTKPVINRDYYKGKTVALEYYYDPDNKITDEYVSSAFIIRIILSSDNGVIMASRDYQANPLGLN